MVLNQFWMMMVVVVMMMMMRRGMTTMVTETECKTSITST